MNKVTIPESRIALFDLDQIKKASYVSNSPLPMLTSLQKQFHCLKEEGGWLIFLSKFEDLNGFESRILLADEIISIKEGFTEFIVRSYCDTGRIKSIDICAQPVYGDTAIANYALAIIDYSGKKAKIVNKN